jgi:hypothetical protein
MLESRRDRVAIILSPALGFLIFASIVNEWISSIFNLFGDHAKQHYMPIVIFYALNAVALWWAITWLGKG